MRPTVLALAICLLGLAAGALAMWACDQQRLVAYQWDCRGIMGTDVQIVVVAPRGTPDQAAKAKLAAMDVLGDIESRMSVYRSDSEISRLNSAGAGEFVPLSQETLEVLRTARDFTPRSGGAFDVTCGPLIELWRQAGKTGRLPAQEEIDHARRLVGWERIQLQGGGAGMATGAVKSDGGARVDLGGIAKKFAIDRACVAMRAAGAQGGLINIGGDIRVFGPSAAGPSWEIKVRDPFDTDATAATLHVRDAAVCTSGDYERNAVIGSHRYSHIVDPRTGMPADAAASVTVIGPSAVDCGLWATALCVLGPDGVKGMEADGAAKGLHALVISGTAENRQTRQTPGMPGHMSIPAK
jgi:thiamine biosynthesis lipoprotein